MPWSSGKFQIAHSDIHNIHRLMGMGDDEKLPRCPARDRNIMRKFEAMGDRSHSGNRHVCEECRCKNVAGAKTWMNERHGDFYGLGVHTGHYGCGFCKMHEKYLSTERCQSFARKHLQAIQQYGRAVGMNPVSKISIMKNEAEMSEHRMKVRKGMDLVVETLEDFKSRVAVTGKNELTEYITGPKGEGSTLGPMSDKTRMDLACTLGKTLASITKDNYAISSEEFVSQDEIALVAYRVVEMTFGRFIADVEQQKKWLNEFSSILNSIRGGNNNARDGQEQAMVEQVPRRTKKRILQEKVGDLSKLGDDEARPTEQADEEPAEPDDIEHPPWES